MIRYGEVINFLHQERLANYQKMLHFVCYCHSLWL